MKGYLCKLLNSYDMYQYLMDCWAATMQDDFNPIEFDGIKKQAGLNSFLLSAKQWRNVNSRLEGNMRDYFSLAVHTLSTLIKPAVACCDVLTL